MGKLLLVAATLALSVAGVVGQNLKPEEIIAKHAESIGPKSARDAVQTIFALGLSEFETSSPAVKGGGRAVVVSDPSNLFFVISLNSREYPYDKIGYFDGKLNLPFVTAGSRSLLGQFLNEHGRILENGLFGGALSLRWPFWRSNATKASLGGGGIKKINDKRVYVVEYQPETLGAANLSIRLRFDPETFRHVGTEYRYELQPRSPTFGVQNQTATSTAVLTEEFSDFKTVGGLNLPHSQKIEFTSNSGNSSYKSTWGVRVAEYRLNQKLDNGFFTFDPK